MSNITSVKVCSQAVIEIGDIEVIKNIRARFDCHTREDAVDEVVLDTIMIHEDKDSNDLFQLLGISGDSCEAEKIVGSHSVVFYA